MRRRPATTRSLGACLSGLALCLAAVACGGATQDDAQSAKGSDAGSGWTPAAAEDTATPAVQPVFAAKVSEQSFPGERFHQVWGTDEELWVLGAIEPEGPSNASANPPTPLLTCGTNRDDTTNVLRRKTTGDFERFEQPSTTALTGLHGSSTSDVWMVGLGGAVYQYDGASWRSHDIRAAQGLAFNEVPCWELSLSAVFAQSPSDVWIVGYVYESTLGPGLILHYDGQGWTRHAVDAPDGLIDVWAASASDVWTVGASGIAYHYDGTSWQRVGVGTEHYLFSVLGTGTNDLWAVGNVSTALHFDGSAWTAVEPFVGYSTSRALAGNLKGGMWLLNTTGETAEQDAWRQSLKRWDGAKWQAVSQTADRKLELQDLHLLPSGELWGVGRSIIRFK